jgi:SAM-dependent methyltransferase
MRALLRELVPPPLVAARRRFRERRWERLPPGRALPFSPAYKHRRALAVARLLAALQAGRTFEELHLLGDRRYAEFDERVVEYPWCFSGLLGLRTAGGRILDVGCVLNQSFCRPLEGLFEERWFLNIVPEPLRIAGHSSLVVADVREAPLPRDHFDAVTCLSTLEHVGMDNALYTGASEERSADPRAASDQALGEMVRMLRPGGLLLVTLPYGLAEDRGWFRVYGAEDLRLTLARLGERSCSVELFRVGSEGWVAARPEECAALRYGDGVPAAQAIACLRYRKPA